MIIKILLIVVYLYITWASFNYICYIFKKYNLQCKTFGGLKSFNTLFITTVLSVIISRAVWLFKHFNDIKQTGFWLLPYIRDGLHFKWLTLYPWKAFAFWQGLDISGLRIAIFIVLTLFFAIPTLKNTAKIKTLKTSMKYTLLGVLLFWWLLSTMLIIFIK